MKTVPRLPPRVRSTMRTLGKRCHHGAASAATRVVQWTDALVERLVCCRQRGVSLDKEAAQEEQALVEAEPQSEPEPDDHAAGSVDGDESRDTMERVPYGDERVDPESDGAYAKMDPPVVPWLPERQVHLLREADLATTIPALVSPYDARSPLSCSSTDSYCSSTASTSSWSDAHSDIVDENAALRKRLAATPARVYDFMTDPRYMSEQQMRRLAILRHRDTMRANLSKTKHQRPQWR